MKQETVAKNYWLWAGVFVICASFLFYFKFDLPRQRLLDQSKASLVIYFGDGHLRKFEGQVISNMTVLEAVNSASVGGGFDFRYALDEQGDVGLASIDKIINTGNNSWHFYLNSNPVPISDINKVLVQPNDLLEVKYESS